MNGEGVGHFRLLKRERERKGGHLKNGGKKKVKGGLFLERIHNSVCSLSASREGIPRFFCREREEELRFFVKKKKGF